MEESTQYKGQLTEQKCFLKCLETGYMVSKPLFDNARYDFILDTGKKLLRIQVKTSVWNKDHSAFSFNGYSQHNNGCCNKRTKYTTKEIDYFMTEKDGTFYLYKAEEQGFATRKLRVSSLQIQRPIRWAKDYVFEEVIKNF